MISFDIINGLNNNTLTEFNLNQNKIDNIEVFKFLENNSSLTILNLSLNYIKNIDVFKFLEKIILQIYQIQVLITLIILMY